MAGYNANKYQVELWEKMLELTRGKGWLEKITRQVEAEKKKVKKKAPKVKNKEGARFKYHEEYEY